MVLQRVNTDSNAPRRNMTVPRQYRHVATFCDDVLFVLVRLLLCGALVHIRVSRSSPLIVLWIPCRLHDLNSNRARGNHVQAVPLFTWRQDGACHLKLHLRKVGGSRNDSMNMLFKNACPKFSRGCARYHRKLYAYIQYGMCWQSRFDAIYICWVGGSV